MIVPVKPPLMTAEEFLALPDEPGVERWLIDGRVREKRFPESTLRCRDRWHALVMSRLAHLFGNWLDGQPDLRGEVLSGEPGFILHRNPDTLIGIDAVYIGPESAARESSPTSMMEGSPTLAVDIVAITDTQEEIDERRNQYVLAGIPLIWIIDPQMATITIYRLDQSPEILSNYQTLTAEPYLPGFKVPVLKVFQRKAKKKS